MRKHAFAGRNTQHTVYDIIANSVNYSTVLDTLHGIGVNVYCQALYINMLAVKLPSPLTYLSWLTVLTHLHADIYRQSPLFFITNLKLPFS